MGINVHNIVGSQEIFKASPEDGQVDTSQGPREIPEDQTVNTDTQGNVSTDTGALSPGTMANDNAIGSITWSNVNNAKVYDGSRTTADHQAAADISHYLKATNFGFAIPTGVTINGIIVEIRMDTGAPGANSCTQNVVKIVKADGNLGSENKSQETALPNAATYVTFGSPTDLWSETWTAENINDIDFGVVLSTDTVEDQSGNANVDHIKITVHYTT